MDRRCPTVDRAARREPLSQMTLLTQTQLGLLTLVFWIEDMGIRLTSRWGLPAERLDMRSRHRGISARDP